MNALPSPMTACWNDKDALSLLTTEALANVDRDDLFMATHSPIDEFVVQGIRASDLRENSEKGLLAALSDPELRHAFAVVRGEPGSGKSHLIRWLAIEWPKQNDIVILLQRADATLRGSLEQLRKRIPAEYAVLIGDVSVQQQASEAGRLRDFLDRLSNALRADYFEKSPADIAFCERYEPSALLRMPGIEGWSAPRRLMGILSNADGQRNSQVAAFELYDVLSLMEFKSQVRDLPVPKARDLFSKLAGETDALEQAREEGLSSDEASKFRSEDFPISIRFIEALNARRNHAIQGSLGVSADKLKGIFGSLRQALQRDKKRLVLLLEDITAFQGLDEGLIDILVTDAGTRSGGDLCPLISVVGLTPSYFEKELAPNYQQRITHDIILGHVTENGDIVDESSFKHTEARARFAARYLSAVRAGPDKIALWNEQRHQGIATAPNACNGCSLREGCHSAFGAIDGIGLFPFTERAFARFYDALHSSHQNQTFRTPRGFLQGILVPTLTRPHALAVGDYPTREIEIHVGINRENTRPGPRLKEILDSAFSDRERHDQARRLIMLWGEPETLSIVGEQEGQTFAGVSRAIHNAFGIEWAWQDLVVPTPRRDTAPVALPASSASVSSGPPDIATALPTRQAPDEPALITRTTAPVPSVTETATPSRKPPRLQRPERGRLERLEEEAKRFRDTGQLDTRSDWESAAADLICGRGKNLIDLSSIDCSEALFDQIFNESRIKIAGLERRSPNRNFIVLPRENWLIDGIIAHEYVANRPRFKDLVADDQAFHYQKLAACLRRLTPILSAQVDRRLGFVNGRRWRPEATLACVLAARAWLRGDISPDEPIAQQIAVILQEEGTSRSDPQSRVDSWDSLLTQTRHGQAHRRQWLKDHLGLKQGTGEKTILAVSAVVEVLQRFKSRLNVPEFPSGDLDEFDEHPFDAVHAAAECDKELAAVARREFERLQDRLRTLDTHLRGLSIEEHFKRVRRLLTISDKKLPNPEKVPQVGSWLQKARRLDDVGFGREAQEIEDTIEKFLNFNRETTTPGNVLSLVAAAPAKLIADVYTLAEEGEKAATHVSDRLEELLRKTGGVSHLSEIQTFGADLEQEAKTLFDRLGVSRHE